MGSGGNRECVILLSIAEGYECEACDETEEDVGDESADIAVLEHL